MRSSAAKRLRPKSAGARPPLAAVPNPGPAGIDLPDGGRAELRGGALEVRDGEGRLRVRYEGGTAEITAPDGDLRLTAPRGRVVVAAGTDLCFEAARLDLRSRAARVVIGEAQIAAQSIATTAERVAVSAGTYEVMAERVVQRSRDALREVTELAEERFGRVRTLVREAFSLSSRRTRMCSEEETSIDGKRVLLG